MLQEGRDREDSTGTEPATHMVPRHMIEHRVFRNLENIILQLFQRRYARHLLFRLWITEDEVTESHMLFHQLMQIHVHLR